MHLKLASSMANSLQITAEPVIAIDDDMLSVEYDLLLLLT